VATTAPTSTSTTSTSEPLGTGGTGGEHATARAHPTAQAGSASHHHAGGSGDAFLPAVLVAAAVAALGGVAVFRWRRRPAEE
jgi:hypothetical protein